jgi:hypothetical protein
VWRGHWRLWEPLDRQRVGLQAALADGDEQPAGWVERHMRATSEGQVRDDLRLQPLGKADDQGSEILLLPTGLEQHEAMTGQEL